MRYTLPPALSEIPARAVGDVAGVSSRGSWFIWPGGLGLSVVVLFVVFLLRRR
jgi:hypothetical protein